MADLVDTQLAVVRERVAQAAQRSGRHVDEVALVAVSKGHPVERVALAYEAGQRIFGESRAQELSAKVSAMPSDVEWHFIGPLQRNKVKLVRPVVRVLHSLDRDELARAWNTGPDALLQVRLGGEDTKHGFEPADALRAVSAASAEGVAITGLMTIPPPVDNPDDNRPWFAALRRLRDRIQKEHEAVSHLSMGMSGDFEVAIEEGATMVRVGSAIFGPRNER